MFTWLLGAPIITTYGLEALGCNQALDGPGYQPRPQLCVALCSGGGIVVPYGCLRLGVLFVGVLVIRPLRFWVYVRAP